MNLSEFRRRIKVGQRVTVVDNLHPHLSGERTVEEVQSARISTRDQNNGFHCAYWGSASLRIEGATLHFLDEDSDQILCSYTFFFETKETAPAEAPQDSGPEPQEPGPLLTSYRVTWAQKGTDTSHTEVCIVDSNYMARPGDVGQRNELLRRMIAVLRLPIGQVVPDNIVLQDVIPVCNCEPYPGENCAWAEHKGVRFYLGPAGVGGGYEAIRDRHDDSVLGVVRNTLSVKFLTLVREEHGHQ